MTASDLISQVLELSPRVCDVAGWLKTIISIRMLKKSLSGVLGTSKSLTYPTQETNCLGSLGKAGRKGLLRNARE
jgi:hypothetical protein